MNPSLATIVQRRNLFATLMLASLLLPCAPASAIECVIPASHHPWARFLPGSWKQVRVTTDSLDESGRVLNTSVTETRTMLLAVGQDSYELKIDVSVRLGEKEFSPETRSTHNGFHGETPGQAVKITDLGDSTIQVAGQATNVHRARIEISDRESTRTTDLQYRDNAQPYILERDSTIRDAGGKIVQETRVTVEKVNVPRVLLRFQHSTWTTRTTQTLPVGRVVTEEVHAADVPGGVVSHTSEEFNGKGTMIRRSQLSLINFGVAKADLTPAIRRPDRKSRRKSR